MWPNTQETADLVTFTEEMLNGKLYFLCSVSLQGLCRTPLLQDWEKAGAYSQPCQISKMERSAKTVKG